MCAIADRFIAQIQIVELKNIIASGFTCIMHAHTAVQEVQFQVLETYFQSNEGGTPEARGCYLSNVCRVSWDIRFDRFWDGFGYFS